MPEVWRNMAEAKGRVIRGWLSQRWLRRGILSITQMEIGSMWRQATPFIWPKRKRFWMEISEPALQQR